MPPKLFHTLCCCIRPSAESYKKNLADAAEVRSDGVVDHYHQGSGPLPQLIDKTGRPLDFVNTNKANATRGGTSYQTRTTAADIGSAGKGGPTPYRPTNGAINNSIRDCIVSSDSDNSTNIRIDHSPPPPSSSTQLGVIHQVQQGPPTSRLWPIGGGGKRQKPPTAKPPALPGDFLLPRLHSLDVNKKCLIIDLDETLVHSSFKPVKSADFIIPVEIDNVVHQVYVLKRPNTDEFLERVGQLFECVLFTASLAKYADPVANLLDKKGLLRARLFREACVFSDGNYVKPRQDSPNVVNAELLKDLDRLGRDINRIVIVDNSPASYAFHPQNAVPVGTWFDDPNDTELLELLPLMEELARCDNIYEVLERQHQHRLPPGAQMQEQMNQVVPQLPSPSPPPPVVPVTNPQPVGLRAANIYNTIAGTRLVHIDPSSTTMIGINREQSSTTLRPTLVTTTISNSVSTIPITIRHSPMPLGGTFQRRSLNVMVVGPTRASTDGSADGTDIRR